jgi:hypothetical protein
MGGWGGYQAQSFCQCNICTSVIESVHLAYNSSFSAYFFRRNIIFLSQQISQQCFSAGLSAQPNGAIVCELLRPDLGCDFWWAYLFGWTETIVPNLAAKAFQHSVDDDQLKSPIS